MRDTITANQLARIAGISERRLRQMAKEGVIPKPIRRGIYGAEAVLSAIIEYYREQGSRSPLRQKKIQEEIRKLRIANDKSQGVLIPRATVNEFLQSVIPATLSIFQQQLLNELPAQAEGRTAAEIRGIATKIYDAVLNGIRPLGDKFNV